MARTIRSGARDAKRGKSHMFHNKISSFGESVINFGDSRMRSTALSVIPVKITGHDSRGVSVQGYQDMWKTYRMETKTLSSPLIFHTLSVPVLCISPVAFRLVLLSRGSLLRQDQISLILFLPWCPIFWLSLNLRNLLTLWILSVCWYTSSK